MRLRLATPLHTDRTVAVIREAGPFVHNRAGLLIHRPKSAVLYNLHKRPHYAVMYYCGNGVTDSGGKLSFMATPPADQLLCEVCESRAVMAGLPSASELAGRHVCVGRLKVIKTCCKEES